MILLEELPRQVKSKEEEETLVKLSNQATVVFSVAFTVPFLVQFALKGVISKLWLWLGMMQLTTGLTLLQINMPENVIIV